MVVVVQGLLSTKIGDVMVPKDCTISNEDPFSGIDKDGVQVYLFELENLIERDQYGVVSFGPYFKQNLIFGSVSEYVFFFDRMGPEATELFTSYFF